MSKLSIIVPVYFNADTIILLYEDLKSKILTKLGDYEIIFVDDGSGDNSWEVMNQIRERAANVQLVKLSKNYGEHSAVLAGLMHCTGDCAVVKQADLVEPAELILEMKESWKKGNKVVLAVRADRDDSFIEKLFANMYYAIVRKFIMSTMPKGGFDCYLIDRQVIEVLR
ncbi:glycosyltransferase, partial [Lachnotalea glycerini]